MQAGDVTLKSIFSDNHRYEIPMFQRPYVWAAEREWAPMWDDIRAAADGVVRDVAEENWPDEPPRYFLGSIVVKNLQRNPQRMNGSSLIDGQQRLTTLQVLLAAAHAVASRIGEVTAAGRFAAWLLNDGATVHKNYPDDRHKLWPLPQDREAYLWAVRTTDFEKAAPDLDHQVCRARVWFESEIGAWASAGGGVPDRLTALHSALADRMQVAMITLEKTDNAQVIFEALNHRGVELSQSDLIKNLLFRLVEDQGSRASAESLLVNHWLPLDSRSWRVDVTSGRITRSRLDVALAYWLTIQKQVTVSVEHLFDEFKKWVVGGRFDAAEVIKSVRIHADLFDSLSNNEADPAVVELVDQITATRTNTVWPLLLSLFSEQRAVPLSERLAAVAALSSYLMRRGICGLTTKDYNNVFVACLKASTSAPPESAGRALVDMLSALRGETRWWPDDAKFLSALLGGQFYSLSRPRQRSFFAGVENHLRDERAEESARVRAVNETLNIEHVMPQAWETNWPLRPAVDAQTASDRREAVVNSVGNLTLTNGRLNSSMRHASWSVKRQALGAKSTLLITTSSILAAPGASVLPGWDGEWDERAINARTMWLAATAVKTWARPEVEDADDLLADEMNESEGSSSASLDDPEEPYED